MAGLSQINERFPLIWAAALVFLFLAGCTESERSGYSSIPQNTPASWEMSPYGDLRN
ncbi:MAG: hypothetical protein IJT50_16845 [Lentisphaeria bacterium]|nr:hypothetical protein [Lentisphaeria bacterium]